MIKTYLKSIIVIVLVLISWQSPPVVYGQTPGQRQAEGIDLILAIDESGSMGGHGSHPQPNDPENKRNQLLHIILPYMVESAYRGNIFRVSVVEFGARGGSSARWRPEVTLSQYKIEKPTTGETQGDYEQRVDRELATLKVDRTRGDSDHGAALDLVLKEIRGIQNKPVPPPMGQIGTTHRDIVIFLITDGMPYVSGFNTDQLKTEIQGIVGRYPQQDAILYAFGLNDADNYWNMGFGNFWDSIAATTRDNKNNQGHAQKFANDKEIVEQILPIISRYTTPPGLEIIYGDTFDCPPYLKAIEYLVEFPRSFMKVSQAVEIVQPDGSMLDTANARESKVHAYIDVTYPLGGIWRFKRKDPDVKLLVRKIYEDVLFLAPVSPVPMRSSHTIRYKATGPGPNNTFVFLPQFPLQARVIIRTPQNTQDLLNAGIDPNHPGEFGTLTPYQFQQAGEYQVEFEASGTSGAGTSLVVLSSTPEKVQVSDSTPIIMEMEAPGGKIHSTLAAIHQEFAIGFYSEDGKKKVPLQDILNTTGPIAATAEVMDAATNVLIKKADFPLSPKADNLAGTIKINLPFMEIFRILAGKRTVKITPQFDQRCVKDSYFLVVPQTQTRLYEYNRKLGEGILTYLILLLILLLVVGTSIWFLWKFMGRQCSNDIPVLVYRQEGELTPDETYNRSITVDKPKIRYKHGDIGFNVPEATELWKPELIIKRHCVEQGVAVTVEYEKFGKTPADKKSFLRTLMEKLKIKKSDPERDRTRKFFLQTRYPSPTSKHPIPEFKETGMLFELKIKGKESF